MRHRFDSSPNTLKLRSIFRLPVHWTKFAWVDYWVRTCILIYNERHTPNVAHEFSRTLYLAKHNKSQGGSISIQALTKARKNRLLILYGLRNKGNYFDTFHTVIQKLLCKTFARTAGLIKYYHLWKPEYFYSIELRTPELKKRSLKSESSWTAYLV